MPHHRHWTLAGIECLQQTSVTVSEATGVSIPSKPGWERIKAPMSHRSPEDHLVQHMKYSLLWGHWWDTKGDRNPRRLGRNLKGRLNFYKIQVSFPGEVLCLLLGSYFYLSLLWSEKCKLLMKWKGATLHGALYGSYPYDPQDHRISNLINKSTSAGGWLRAHWWVLSGQQ